MLEMKLRMDSDGKWWVYAPSGTYRCAKSVDELSNAVRGCLLDYTAKLGELARSNVDARKNHFTSSTGRRIGSG